MHRTIDEKYTNFQYIFNILAFLLSSMHIGHYFEKIRKNSRQRPIIDVYN